MTNSDDAASDAAAAELDDDVLDDGELAEGEKLPDLRYGGALQGQATVRMALIAIGLVFFIGVAVGYLLGHGA